MYRNVHTHTYAVHTKLLYTLYIQTQLWVYTGEVGGETSCGRSDIIVNQQLYGFVSAVCVCVCGAYVN